MRWTLTAASALMIGVGAVGIVSVDGSTVSRPDPTAAGRGAALFAAKGCATCHLAPDGSSPAMFVGVGPSLDGIAERAAARAGDPVAYLAESVLDPSAVVAPGWSGAYPEPGPGLSPMPVLPLSDAEVDDLVAFLLEGGDT